VICCGWNNKGSR